MCCGGGGLPAEAQVGVQVALRRRACCGGGWSAEAHAGVRVELRRHACYAGEPAGDLAGLQVELMSHACCGADLPVAGALAGLQAEPMSHGCSVGELLAGILAESQAGLTRSARHGDDVLAGALAGIPTRIPTELTRPAHGGDVSAPIRPQARERGLIEVASWFAYRVQ